MPAKKKRRSQKETKSVSVRVRMTPSLHDAAEEFLGDARKIPGLLRRLLRAHIGGSMKGKGEE